MSIIVNGTTIPTTKGNIIYNGTQVEKVVYNGTTVWEVPTSVILIQNGNGLSTPAITTSEVTIADGITYPISTNYTYTPSNNGAKITFSNNSSDSVLVKIKYPTPVICKGQKLYISANIVCDNAGSGDSSFGLNLIVFDNNGNIINTKFAVEVGVNNDEDWKVDAPASVNNYNITLPTSGTYYVGYGITMWHSKGAKFTVTVSSLSVK